MKHFVRYFGCLLLGAFFLSVPLVSSSVAKVDTAGPRQRPFNWYYPYSYRYYTPHREYGSRQCYWYYTNGQYVYTCR